MGVFQAILLLAGTLNLLLVALGSRISGVGLRLSFQPIPKQKTPKVQLQSLRIDGINASADQSWIKLQAAQTNISSSTASSTTSVNRLSKAQLTALVALLDLSPIRFLLFSIGMKIAGIRQLASFSQDSISIKFTSEPLEIDKEVSSRHLLSLITTLTESVSKPISLRLSLFDDPKATLFINGLTMDVPLASDLVNALKGRSSENGEGDNIYIHPERVLKGFDSEAILINTEVIMDALHDISPSLSVILSDVVITHSNDASIIDLEGYHVPSLMLELGKIAINVKEESKNDQKVSTVVIATLTIENIKADTFNTGLKNLATVRVLTIPNVTVRANVVNNKGNVEFSQRLTGGIAVTVDSPSFILRDEVLRMLITYQRLRQSRKRSRPPTRKLLLYQRDGFEDIWMSFSNLLSKISVSMKLSILSPIVGIKFTEYHPLTRNDVDALVFVEAKEITAELQKTPTSPILKSEALETSGISGKPLSFDLSVEVSGSYLSFLEIGRASIDDIHFLELERIRLLSVSLMSLESGLWLPPVEDLIFIQSSMILSSSVAIKSVSVDCSPIAGSKIVDFFALALSMRSVIECMQSEKPRCSAKPEAADDTVFTSASDVSSQENDTAFLTITIAVTIEDTSVTTADVNASGVSVNLGSIVLEANWVGSAPHKSPFRSVLPEKISFQSEVSGEAKDLVAFSLSNISQPLTCDKELLLNLYPNNGKFCSTQSCLREFGDIFLFLGVLCRHHFSRSIIKIAKLIAPHKRVNKLKNAQNTSGASELPNDLINVEIKVIELELTMMILKERQAFIASVSSATILALSDAETGMWDELVELIDILVQIHKPKQEPTSPLFISKSTLKLLPYIINTSKALKNTVFQNFGLQSSSESLASGKTRILQSQIPTIQVFVESLSLCLYDSDFEVALSANYRKGLEEQAASMLENNQITGNVSESRELKSIENAWWLLQEFNAKAWADKIRKTFPRVKKPLLKATISNVSVDLIAPILPASFVEESLHIIDPETPKDRIYEELIPEPGLIAEPSTSREAKRVATLSLGPISTPHPIVNPVKIYTQTKTTITTSSDVIFNWAHLLKSLWEMWWDKLRLILHGQNSIHVTGGGNMRLRILGSGTPYFDPRTCYGIEGLETVIREGYSGGCGWDGGDFVIECGQMLFSLPFSKAEKDKPVGARRIPVDEDVIATFMGGVRNICWDADGDDRLKTHAEVLLRHPDYYIDSLRGFRTECIDISINIQSPRPFFSSLTNPMNAVCLSGNSLRRLQILTSIYQSPLTVIPIQRGRLFGFPEGDGAVGVRCRAEKMDLQVCVKQNQAQSKAKGEPKSNRWLLESSEVELSEVEGRVISFQTDVSETVDRKALTQDEIREWLLDVDYEYIEDLRSLTLEPCVWSPKIMYYKRDSVTKKSLIRSNAHISAVQIGLYQSRLREIESSIRHFLDNQKGLEYRMTLFFDDSLRQQSDNISEKISLLMEKKNAILQKIKILKMSVENHMLNDQFSEYKTGSAFNHLFVVHNLNFLWEQSIRNAVFKFFDIMERDSSLRFCLSSAALKTVSDLLSLSANKDISDVLFAESAQHPTKSTDSLSSSSKFDSNMAKELLQKLLNSANSRNIIVNNEMFNRGGSISADDLQASGNIGSRFSVYTPSTTPDSLDYVPMNQRAESGYVVQLINPQITLVSSKSDDEDIHSILVAAESMLLRSIGIVDADSETGGPGDTRNRNVNLIKKRTILNLHKAQFFVAKKLDDQMASDVDGDNIETYKHLHAGGREGADKFWPLWAPLEIVDQTSACFYRDKPNPLYVKKKGTDMKTLAADQTDFIYVGFEDFVISMTSLQYLVLSDIITNLLVYKDPVRQVRTTKLRKMLLALQQFDGLQKVVETVLRLQEKIKNAEMFLRFGHGGKLKDDQQYSPKDLRKSLIQYEDELNQEEIC
ncbi:RNA pol II promoter Fmp27 protein domain-containing protein [Chytridium lagenaria]|nr:RNA pol II promoter Fmp27 protein domain-containing protein [Chytridium lagenaria]